jgi:hypothetical protein
MAEKQEIIKTIDKMPVSFVILAVFIGIMIGSVAGSLLSQIFGFDFLDRSLFAESITIIHDFYFLQKVSIRLSAGSLLGFFITLILIYRKIRST